ncbi:MAG: molecular chaperone TorD family protein [Proteobacteria bacterium]|nr:molecular chaperone TorD family protein [Pseudomonadota bacterium]
MSKLPNTARARSQLFQLLALGFVHPTEEFHRLLENGSYPLALARAAHAALGMDIVIGHTLADYSDYEADYINLFQMGKRGQPIIHLNAGDYEELLDGGSRPEFLLEYSGWYRHFGLKTNEDDQANELPDHIVCQLELLAWLTHLESTTSSPESQTDYQRAQRDFFQRHFYPMLELLVTAMQRENSKNPISPFFLKLATTSLEAVSLIQSQLLATVGEASHKTDNPDQIASVNLWG